MEYTEMEREREVKKPTQLTLTYFFFYISSAITKIKKTMARLMDGDEMYGLERFGDDRAVQWLGEWVSIWRANHPNREAKLETSMNTCLMLCTHSICPSACHPDRRNGVKSLLVRFMNEWATGRDADDPICGDAWGDGPPDPYRDDGDAVLARCYEFLLAQYGGVFRTSHDLRARYITIHSFLYKFMHIADMGAPYIVMQYLKNHGYIESKFGITEASIGARLHPDYQTIVTHVTQAIDASTNLLVDLPFDAHQWREVSTLLIVKAAPRAPVMIRGARIQPTALILTCHERASENKMCFRIAPGEQRTFRVDDFLDRHASLTTNRAVTIHFAFKLHSLCLSHLDEIIDTFLLFEERSARQAYTT